MTSEKRLSDLTELEGVLDTFGGDPGRWPASKRERLIGIAASDEDARRLLREAAALDAVLTRAAGPPVGNTVQLAERIAAAAAGVAQATRAADSNTERQQEKTGEPAVARANAGVVIAWPRSGPAARAAVATETVAPRRYRSTANWRTAAMLAASLLVGVFVGALDLVPNEVSQFVAGIDSGSETTQAMAFLQSDGFLEFLDEGPL